MTELHDLVDLGRYPIDLPGSPAYVHLIEDLRRELGQDGCAVLRGFVHAAGVQQLLAEAEAVADKGLRLFRRTNVYFGRDDSTLPPDHPVRRFYDRSNAFIPADHFGPNSPLRRIYAYSGFMRFIRDALQEPEDRFFRHDDPLADVIINMVETGDGFPWHFDTNTYTVTLAIQNARAGGAFEYVPSLRSRRDENYDGVRRVLDGNRAMVRQLELKPGDLQIFRGRNTLHRVAPVRDGRCFVGVFSFAVSEPEFDANSGLKSCEDFRSRATGPVSAAETEPNSSQEFGA